jgi:hypothetical protein
MRRPLCWTEKLDDGVKREVRVSFQGKGIRWQWKREDEEKWVYDAPPTALDWDNLDALAQNWYTRHRLPIEHIERIRRLRKESGL